MRSPGLTIRHAHRRDWPRPAQFPNPVDGAQTMATDFFCRVAVGPDATFVVDTGCAAEGAERRGRDYLQSPIETLTALGVDVPGTTDLILTHLHSDHVGAVIGDLKAARLLGFDGG